MDGLSPWVKNKRDSYDLIVMRGGHAGLTAAVHAAREGVDTLIIERTGARGRRAMIECMDNCPPVPKGMVEGEPAPQTTGRAKRFTVQILTGQTMVAIRAGGPRKVVRIETGDEYCARALLLVPGTSNECANIPGHMEGSNRRNETKRYGC